MRKYFRFALKGLGLVLVLLVLFHLVEDVRGRQAWKGWLKARRRSGLPVALADFAPPPVPEARNFAAAPLIAEVRQGHGWGVSFTSLGRAMDVKYLGQWRFGLHADLKALRRDQGLELGTALAAYDPVLDRLAEAARRPQNRFLDQYSEPDAFGPGLLGFRSVARVLSLRAMVRLEQGQTGAAFDDVQTGLRVVNHLRLEPYLTQQLLRMACLSIMMQPVWEGIQAHQWNEAQLAGLQEELATVDMLASWKLGLLAQPCYQAQSDQAGWWTELKAGRHWSKWAEKPMGRPKAILRSLFLPQGWKDQNHARSAMLFDEVCCAPLDAARHRVYPEQQAQAEARLRTLKRGPYTFLISNFVPAFAEQNQRVARLQAGLDQARVACALERYRLARKTYPASLREGLGAYLPEVPRDLMTGRDLGYERTASGGYRLWSLGWEGKDHAGNPGPDPRNLALGNWCWSVPR